MGTISLKGKYTISITYQRMFHTYTARYSSTNLITEKGLNYLVNKWNNEEGQITEIIVGDNRDNPKPEDTIGTFTNWKRFEIIPHVEGNKLVMTNNNISGKQLNGTREIGVIAQVTNIGMVDYEDEIMEETESEEILVSRDTHPTITIPETSIISMEYVYTLTSLSKDECT